MRQAEHGLWHFAGARRQIHWFVGPLTVALLASACAAGPISTRLPREAASPNPGRPSPNTRGTASPPPALHLVAVGDSIAASQLCQCPRYPDVYSELAAKALGQPVRAQNMAVNGATSADLLYRLENMGPFQSALREADLITISIGLNDIGSCAAGTDRKCYDSAIAAVETNLEAILTQIDALQGNHSHILRETAYYNVYVGGLNQQRPTLHSRPCMRTNSRR
jgi:lysophospholipase L1-like esterase